MALQHWKKLNQRVLLQHPRLTVFEDDVQLPDGTPTTYLHFGTQKKINSVAVIAINAEGKFLVQKELSYPVGEFLWQWPGGGVNPQENILAAANRELQEEAGWRAQHLEMLAECVTDNRRSANRQGIVIARNLERASLPGDIEEAFEHHWLTSTEIQQLITSGETMSAYFLACWMLFLAKEIS